VSPPRIAFLMPMHWSFSLGGAEMQVRLLLERMVARGDFDLHFIAREADLAAPAAGYTLHRLRSRRSIAGTYPLDVGPLLDLLDEIGPDVVYQRVGGAYTAAAAWYARRRGRRMVWHVSSNNDVAATPWRADLRAPFEQLDRRLIDFGAARATRIVVQNREQASAIQRRYGRADAIRIPNFHPLPAAAPRPRDARPVVAWVANLKPLKQPELFVRLAQDLRDRTDARFLMIGAQQMDGPAWEALQATIRSLPNLEYAGGLSPAEVNLRLAQSHLLVNTSQYEGFPNTFIQAWMRELPVLSLNVDPDGLLDGTCYGRCARGSYEVLRDAVLALLQDGAARERLGQASAAAARESFSEQNADRLIDLLAQEARAS